MADLGGPDHEVTLAEYKLSLSQQATNMHSHSLRRAQIAVELRRLDANDLACLDQIKTIEQKIKELESKGVATNG